MYASPLGRLSAHFSHAADPPPHQTPPLQTAPYLAGDELHAFGASLDARLSEAIGSHPDESSTVEGMRSVAMDAAQRISPEDLPPVIDHLVYQSRSIADENLRNLAGWMLKAHVGDPESHYRLADLLAQNGRGGLATATKIIRSWKLAAMSHHPEANYKLGLTYLHSGTSEQHHAIAEKLLTYAYVLGQRQALTDLALRRLHVPQSFQDIDMGMGMLNQAHREGDPRATLELARIHDAGTFGIPRDGANAVAFFSSAASAQAPHEAVADAAKLALGKKYAHGEDVNFDPHIARYWLAPAVSAGDSEALAAWRLVDERERAGSEDFLNEISAMLLN